MIPTYPNSVEWFLIDRQFSKQWLDHCDNDHAPHGTGKAQDLSFQMACFQGCTDHVVLLPRTQVDTHTNNTPKHTQTQTQTDTHTHTHAHTHTRARARARTLVHTHANAHDNAHMFLP